jgi:hypothetical protein
LLEDERRVITQNGMLNALGLGHGGVSQLEDAKGYRLTSFVKGKRLNPFISNKLAEGIVNPIVFLPPRGRRAYGYEATILADLCEAVLEARKQGVLTPNQRPVADQCEILVRGFARIGIIALVDEATGYPIPLGRGR